MSRQKKLNLSIFVRNTGEYYANRPTILVLSLVLGTLSWGLVRAVFEFDFQSSLLIILIPFSLLIWFIPSNPNRRKISNNSGNSNDSSNFGEKSVRGKEGDSCQDNFNNQYYGLTDTDRLDDSFELDKYETSNSYKRNSKSTESTSGQITLRVASIGLGGVLFRQLELVALKSYSLESNCKFVFIHNIDLEEFDLILVNYASDEVTPMVAEALAGYLQATVIPLQLSFETIRYARTRKLQVIANELWNNLRRCSTSTDTTLQTKGKNHFERKTQNATSLSIADDVDAHATTV
jgi:hypothetical protein